MEKACPGLKDQLPTGEATLGGPTFHTFSLKTWKNVKMRTKKGGWKSGQNGDLPSWNNLL